MRRTTASTIAIALFLLAAWPRAQGTAPASPLTMISRDGRRPVPTTVLNGQEVLALDDLATLFGVAVREDSLTGGVTLTYRGRTIIPSLDQPIASVNGRVVALPSAMVRSGRRWLVPLEFLPRALGPIYDQRIDLRRASRLLIVGDVRVPRVTARVEAAGPPTRATLEVSPATGISLVTEPGRVLVRIDATALDLALPPTGGGLIDQIRAGDQQNSIVLLLAAGAGVARATSTTRDTAAIVTVEVPAAATPGDTTSGARGAPAPAPPAITEPVLAPPRESFDTVVIDPGHGGDDTGAKGSGGLAEKDLTLDVARRLRGLVESRLGLRVILTREDDRLLGLNERAAIANNSKADLFLSLHANAAPSPTVSGAEVYYLRLDADGEQARREAAADAITLPVVNGGTRTIDLIRWDLAQARHVERSAALAQMLVDALRMHTTVGPRPLQQAGMRVLEGTNMPAALVEMAYLTNPTQERAAGRDDYKNAVAQALYETIVAFRSRGATLADR